MMKSRQANGNRQPRRSTVCSSLTFDALEDRRLLATFTVTNVNDAGAGSLREAITTANNTTGADTITFDSGVFNTSQTIDLNSQLPTITDDLTITGTGAELLTLDAGNGADNVFASGDGFRIFDITDNNANSQLSVTISGLTLTGGDTSSNSAVSSAPTEPGGAIRSSENLLLVDSAITGNATGSGSATLGFGSDSGSGGGIYSTGTLTVTNSIVSGNATGSGSGGAFVYGGDYDGSGRNSGAGGGIFSTGVLVVSGSTVSGNTTGEGGSGSSPNSYGYGYQQPFPGNGGNSGAGGGIYSAGTLEVTSSTISGNTTGFSGIGGLTTIYNGDVSYSFYEGLQGTSGGGGGIYNAGTGTLTSSTVSGNQTGSGLYSGATGYVSDYGVGGGGVFNRGSLAIVNGTISGNATRSSGDGGGIYNGGLLTITGSTINGNAAGFFQNAFTVGAGGGIFNVGTADLSNTIVANNRPGGAIEGSSVSGSFNLIDDGSGGLEDTITFDPRLGPLADNGGPTQTHALLAGSPAVGNGSNALAVDAGGNPLLTDQRGPGFNRIASGTVDIGAFESDFETPSFVVDTTSDIVDASDGLTSLREAITAANARPGSDTVTFSADVFTGGNASLIRLTEGQLTPIAGLTIDGSTATGVTITGDANGNDITIGANITDVAASGAALLADNSRVLNLSSSSSLNPSSFIEDLTLINLTLTGGRTTEDDADFFNSTDGGGIRFFSAGTLELRNTVVSGNSTVGDNADGGGIFTNSGSLVLENSTVSGNSTGGFVARGGGIFSDSGTVSLISSTINDNGTSGENGYGGGIFARLGDVDLTNSTLSNNSTTGGDADGGGVFSASGSVTLTNSTLSGNSTTGNNSSGGGVLVNSGAVTLFESTVSDNVTLGDYSYGGGIRNTFGDITLTRSTVSGNRTEGLFAFGGGIQTFSGAITLANSTVSGNSTTGIDGDGAGLWFNNSTVLIFNSTITNNNAANSVGGGLSLFADSNDQVLTIQNSIIAGNSDNGTAPDFEAPDNPTTNLVVSNSLIGNNTGTTLSASAVGLTDADGNFIGTPGLLIAPLLGPLANNGGVTLTHALLPGSLGINAGSNALAVDEDGNSLLNDQRGAGFGRVFGGTVDIGAFEFGSVTTPVAPEVTNIIRDEGGVLDWPDLLSTFSVSFDADVNVSADDLVIRNDTLGGTVVDSSAVTLEYDAATFTATWNFGSLILDPAFYSFELTSDIVSVAGNLSLDGDADGNPGGTFIESVYVAIPGDANLDGQVNVLGDAFALIGNLGLTGGAAWAQGDFNGDGNVNVLGDAFILIGNLGQSVLPPTAALASSQNLASIVITNEPASFITEQEDDRPPVQISSPPQQLALAGSQDIDAAFESTGLIDDGLF